MRPKDRRWSSWTELAYDFLHSQSTIHAYFSRPRIQCCVNVATTYECSLLVPFYLYVALCASNSNRKIDGKFKFGGTSFTPLGGPKYSRSVCRQLFKPAYFITSPPLRVQSIAIILYVCLSVRLHISKTACLNFAKLSVHVTQAVAWSSSDGNATCYVLPVLWTTSYFYIIQRMGQNQIRRVWFVYFARWQHYGRSLRSPTACCSVFGTTF